MLKNIKKHLMISLKMRRNYFKGEFDCQDIMIKKRKKSIEN